MSENNGQVAASRVGWTRLGGVERIEGIAIYDSAGPLRNGDSLSIPAGSITVTLGMEEVSPQAVALMLGTELRPGEDTAAKVTKRVQAELSPPVLDCQGSPVS